MRRLSKPTVVSMLMLWAGAALMLGAVAAPTLFNPSVLDDRELSGAIVGAILKRFYLISYYLFAFCALVSLLGWMVDLTHRKRMAFLFFLSTGLLIINGIEDKQIRTEMVRLKLEIKNAPDPAQRTALQERFNQLHKVSELLYKFAAAIALVGAGYVLFRGDVTGGRPAHKSRPAAKKPAAS